MKITPFNLLLVRTVGLPSDIEESMLGDRPDAIYALRVTSDDTLFSAMEVKTMTTSMTVYESCKITTCGLLIKVSNIRIMTESNSLSQKAVLTTFHRQQCLHVALVCFASKVLYVMTKGIIGDIYALLRFSSILIESYRLALNSIKMYNFEWIGKAAT